MFVRCLGGWFRFWDSWRRAVQQTRRCNLRRCAKNYGSRPITQSVPAQTKAGGELVLLSLDPPIGSTLTEGSVIRAAFEYRLINQDQIAIYALVPFFSDRAGEGRTFNALTDPTSVLRLMAPSGRVEMHYSVAAEWSNAYRLAKPPEVWFDLVERYPRSGTRVVAELGPFRFNSP